MAVSPCIYLFMINCIDMRTYMLEMCAALFKPATLCSEEIIFQLGSVDCAFIRRKVAPGAIPLHCERSLMSQYDGGK
jgi:hypothetical protein